MPLDDDTAQLLELLADSGAPAMSEGTVAQARANYDGAVKPPPEPVARVEDRTIPGPAGPIPVRLYADGAADRPPIVAFFHGGGWVLSSVDGHDAIARRIAIRSGALVVSVDYRVAPEAPFPAPHDDCFAATAWLTANGDTWGGDRSRVAVCGDSAGGNLAAGVALRARDEGLALVLQALMYPCIDDRQHDYPSMDENRAGYFLTAADMEWFWDRFVPPAHRGDPRAVPARATDLAGLAPAFVQTAEYDPLRDEGERYAQRLAAAGVACDLVRYPGVVHGFMTRWHAMARADQAHDDLAAALRSAFAGPR
ncbi:MAG TPA: alpha/beta hydrolase [Ilumatobacter sp.]